MMPAELACSTVWWLKSHSNMAIGISIASTVPTTMGNGMSRWVMSTSWPRRRSRAEARASTMPLTIGRRIFSSVHTAATAIAAAGMAVANVRPTLRPR